MIQKHEIRRNEYIEELLVQGGYIHPDELRYNDEAIKIADMLSKVFAEGYGLGIEAANDGYKNYVATAKALSALESVQLEPNRIVRENENPNKKK